MDFFGETLFIHDFLHLVLGGVLLLLSATSMSCPELFGRARHSFAFVLAVSGIGVILPAFQGPSTLSDYVGRLSFLALLVAIEGCFLRRHTLRLLIWGALTLTAILLPIPQDIWGYVTDASRFFLGLILCAYMWNSARYAMRPQERAWRIRLSVSIAIAHSLTFVPELFPLPELRLELLFHCIQIILLCILIFSPALLFETEDETQITNGVAASIFTGLVVAFLSLCWINNHLLYTANEEVRLSLLHRTKAIAATIPVRWLDSLQGDLSDIGRLEHDLLRNRLLQVIETQLDIRSISLLQVSEGYVRYLVDVEPRRLSAPESGLAMPGDYLESPDSVLAMVAHQQPRVMGPFPGRWGKSLQAIIPLADEQEETARFFVVMEMPEELYLRTISANRKSMFAVSLLVIALFGFGWLIFIRSRKRTLEELQQVRLVAANQARLAKFATQSMRSFREASQHADELLSEILSVETASVWLFEGNFFRCMDHFDRTTRRHREGELLALEEQEAFRSLFRSQRQQLVAARTGWVETEEWQQLPKGVFSRLDTALFQEGTPVGFIRLEARHPGQDWKQSSLFATSAADLLTVALERELRLRVSEEHAAQTVFLQGLLDSLPVAVMVKSRKNTRYLIWNQHAEALTGIPADHAIGKLDAEIFPGILANLFEEQDLHLSQIHGQLTIPRSEINGHTIHWIRLSLAQQTPPHGILLTIGIDISERVRAEQDLQAANQQLASALQKADELATKAKAASEAKSQFLATMSHEIRTPMNGVLGMLRLLGDTTLNEDQREFADLARSSAESLLSIINEILDFSRIESGRMQIDRHSFEFRHMLQEVIRLFDSQARERGIELHLHEEADLPDNLVGDSTRFRQILTNLIGNAIKFTPQGQVDVSVRRVAESAGTIRLRFDILDTGIGIPEDKQSLLFHPFSQADTSLVRKFGGSGLGLAITKHLVELMGGEISFTSELGVGSTFWFELDFQTTLTDPALEIGAKDGGKGVSLKGRVLVVEDNHINQKLCAKLLEKLGLQSEYAENGKIALEKISGNQYDLVLMDVQMPEMDGFQATQEIRAGKAGEQNRNIPIIALTALILSNDRSRCMSAGMNDYLSKPVQFDQLRSVLTRFLNPVS